MKSNNWMKSSKRLQALGMQKRHVKGTVRETEERFGMPKDKLFQNRQTRDFTNVSNGRHCIPILQDFTGKTATDRWDRWSYFIPSQTTILYQVCQVQSSLLCLAAVLQGDRLRKVLRSFHSICYLGSLNNWRCHDLSPGPSAHKADAKQPWHLPQRYQYEEQLNHLPTEQGKEQNSAEQGKEQNCSEDKKNGKSIQETTLTAHSLLYPFQRGKPIKYFMPLATVTGFLK